MHFSEELQSKIKKMFDNDEELRNKLLEGDTDSIKKLASLRIMPEEIVEAYESDDSETMKKLYIKAKRMFELQKLYKELC